MLLACYLPLSASATIDVWDLSSGTQLVVAGAMVAVGATGFFTYDFLPTTPSLWGIKITGSGGGGVVAQIVGPPYTQSSGVESDVGTIKSDVDFLKAKVIEVYGWES